MIRALSLPTDYGSIAKVYVTQDAAKEMISTPTVATMEDRNPLSLDMYILAYDSDKKLVPAATTLKENLEETERLSDMYDDYILSKTSLTQKQLDKVKKGKYDWYFDTDDAIKYKIIDQII